MFARLPFGKYNAERMTKKKTNKIHPLPAALPQAKVAIRITHDENIDTGLFIVAQHLMMRLADEIRNGPSFSAYMKSLSDRRVELYDQFQIDMYIIQESFRLSEYDHDVNKLYRRLSSLGEKYKTLTAEIGASSFSTFRAIHAMCLVNKRVSHAFSKAAHDMWFEYCGDKRCSLKLVARWARHRGEYFIDATQERNYT
jgi:hypothetical protein